MSHRAAAHKCHCTFESQGDPNKFNNKIQTKFNNKIHGNCGGKKRKKEKERNTNVQASRVGPGYSFVSFLDFLVFNPLR